jgi:hypothetical protein
MEKEKGELADQPESELEELTGLYEAKGPPTQQRCKLPRNSQRTMHSPRTRKLSCA